MCIRDRYSGWLKVMHGYTKMARGWPPENADHTGRKRDNNKYTEMCIFLTTVLQKCKYLISHENKIIKKATRARRMAVRAKAPSSYLEGWGSIPRAENHHFIRSAKSMYTTISPFTFIWGACDDMMMFSIIISGVAWQFLVLWWKCGTLMAVGSVKTLPWMGSSAGPACRGWETQIN